MKVYDFEVEKMNGEQKSLSDYKGQVLLVVNTATECGFTPQYEGLQALYEKYKDQGFEILDFPCNQFANQAKGTSEEIHNFCTSRYGITFPQFAKIEVNGENADLLYKYLKKQKRKLLGSRIKWNFTKFLVDRDGNVVERFESVVKPEKIDSYVQALL